MMGFFLKHYSSLCFKRCLSGLQALISLLGFTFAEGNNAQKDVTKIKRT